MKRSDVEALRSTLRTQYADTLKREQPHLTSGERETLALGFQHGTGWLIKALEGAGLKLTDDAAGSAVHICVACRLPVAIETWVWVETGGRQCPNCGTVQ